MRHVETLRQSNCFHESRPQMQPRSKVSELLIDGSQRATMSSGVARSGFPRVKGDELSLR